MEMMLAGSGLTSEPEIVHSLGTLFNGGPLEDMLLRRVLSYLHLHDIACIGPTVSRAWLRCVVEHCYPQLMVPGREVEVLAWAPNKDRDLGDATRAREHEYLQDSANATLARVVSPPTPSTISCEMPAPKAAQTAATTAHDSGANQELFVKLVDGGGSCSGADGAIGDASNASSVVWRVRAADLRPISRVCPEPLEGWLQKEVMEGSKPLAMRTATTLSAFLPFCCQRCGAPAAQHAIKDVTLHNGGGAAGKVVEGDSNEWFNDRHRFAARQLRPGVRENLSWMTIEDRRKRLHCVPCLILEAGEVGRPSRHSNFISRSNGGVRAATDLDQEDRPSPWLHIDFHTGGRGDSATAALRGDHAPRKQQAQFRRPLATYDEACEWLEANYMGADEFCAALTGNLNRNQLQVDMTATGNVVDNLRRYPYPTHDLDVDSMSMSPHEGFV